MSKPRQHVAVVTRVCCDITPHAALVVQAGRTFDGLNGLAASAVLQYAVHASLKLTGVVLPLLLPSCRCQQQSLDSKLQRVVAISVARGMAYLHTRSPPILHLVSNRPLLLPVYQRQTRRPLCLSSQLASPFASAAAPPVWRQIAPMPWATRLFTGRLVTAALAPALTARAPRCAVRCDTP